MATVKKYYKKQGCNHRQNAQNVAKRLLATLKKKLWKDYMQHLKNIAKRLFVTLEKCYEKVTHNP